MTGRENNTQRNASFVRMDIHKLRFVQNLRGQFRASARRSVV